ncbi:MAG: DUF6531 domain-containing protein, partial [Blastocatellia bacterium]
MLYTSQPGAAVSSVPMPVIYPNLAGLDPGTVVDLYTFNHDTVQWEKYGTGQVSADGRTIGPQTNPATGQPYGLMTFSWHGPNTATGGNPSDPDCGNRSHNPVDLATGEKIETPIDIAFGGARGGLTLQRVFTADLSSQEVFGRFGRGWKDGLDYELTGTFTSGGAGRLILPQDQTGILFNYQSTGSDGSLVFTNTGTVSLSGDVLTKHPDGTFLYRYKDGATMQFGSSGNLIATADRNGNTTTLTYTGGNLTQIADPVGRSINLTYITDAGHQVVSSATDPIGRTWTYGYSDQFVSGGCQLVSVTDPLAAVVHYGYQQSQLITITDKRGVVAKTITYDERNRVISEQFADGGVEQYSYAQSGGIVTTTTVVDPLGRRRVIRFSGNGYTLEIDDPLGQRTQFIRDIGTNLPLQIIGPCGCGEGTYT